MVIVWFRYYIDGNFLNINVLIFRLNNSIVVILLFMYREISIELLSFFDI